MSLGLNVIQHVADPAVSVEDEGGTNDTHTLLTVGLLFLPNTIGITDLPFGIRE